MSPLKFPFFRKKKDLPPPHSIPHRQDFYSFQQQHHHSIAPLQLITPLHCQCQLCSPTQPVPMPQYPYHHQQPWFQPIQPHFVPLTAAAGATAVANATANSINNINNTTNNNNSNNNTGANSNITTAQFQQPYQCACQRCPHQHPAQNNGNSCQPAPQLLPNTNQSYLRLSEHIQHIPQLCQNFTNQPELQSRYANVESIRQPAHSNNIHQEPLYCNQKALESTLPPYQPPPDYATFMAQKKLATLHGRHTSHHSESVLMQRVTDSSYENLKLRNSLYGNLNLCKHQYTS